jgi:large subunit ribosomal protein L28
MSRTCQVTGKRVTTGNNVSHANNKTRAAGCPTCTSAASGSPARTAGSSCAFPAHALRTIDKNGIESVLAELRARGEKI